MNAFRQLLHPLTHRVSEVHRVPHQRVPLGTWLMSASPMVAEAVGCAGFDWVVVDMEHSPLELGGVVSLLQALGSTRTVPDSGPRDAVHSPFAPVSTLASRAPFDPEA